MLIIYNSTIATAFIRSAVWTFFWRFTVLTFSWKTIAIGTFYMQHFVISRFIIQYITGYDARNPNGNIIPSPTQNIESNRDATINPGIRNAIEFSANSIDVMLAVSPDTATFTACLRDILFSKGIIVKA